MNETSLTIAAAILEIGTPIVLLAVFKFFPRARKRLIVIIGSLTPISLLYLGFFISLLWMPESQKEDNDWAMHAMWGMSFAAFALSLLIGVFLAFFKRPEGMRKRYLFGFMVPLLIATIEAFHKHGHIPFWH